MKKLIAFLIIIAALHSTGCAMIFRHMKEKRDTTYEEGVRLYNQGKYTAAHDKFKTVISIDPEYGKIKYYYGQTSRYLKKKEQRSRQKANSYYTQGKQYMKAKRYEAALNMFLIVKEEDENYEDVDFQISECRDNLETTFNAVMKYARKLNRQGRYNDAYNQCERAKKLSPMSPDASILMKDIEEAMDERSEPYEKKAVALMEKQRYEYAKNLLGKAIYYNPVKPELKEMINECNKKIAIDTDYKGALRLYQRKQYFPAYYSFKALERKEKGFKKTEVYIQQLETYLKNNIWQYYNLGQKYYDKGDYKSAVREWNNVLAIDPNHQKAREYRERAMAKLEMKESLSGGK